MKAKLFLPLAAAVLCLASCAPLRADSEAAAAEPKTETPTFRMKGETLVAAFCDDDAERFLNALTPEMRRKFKEEHFDAIRKEMRKTLGEPESFVYLTELETPLVHPMIWKVRFLKENENGGSSVHEALFRVIVGNADGKDLILGFGFL